MLVQNAVMQSIWDMLALSLAAVKLASETLVLPYEN